MSDVVTSRILELERVVCGGEPSRSDLDACARLSRDLGAASSEWSYLVLAVLRAEIPVASEIVDFVRQWRVGGIEALLATEVKRARRRARFTSPPRVRVSSGVVMDVTDTSRSAFTTGIQRVARETVARWTTGHGAELLAWNANFTALTTLEPELREQAGGLSAPDSPIETVIPFGGVFLLPEIAVEPRRASRLAAIAAHSGSRTAAIGFDCIPVSTAETAGPGMPGAFSKYLAALSRFDVVVPISEASAGEYRGWRSMLGGAGLLGPEIVTVELPTTGVPEVSSTLDATRAELHLGDGAIVLAVGSHEPRKNHINFLHAAELNWRAGHEFTVVMVGGNSWDTEAFDRVVDRLRRRGRPLLTISGAADQTVWDLYRLARFTVFCSVNEGFGLPVVESLASGTPVITSDFGSMRDLGSGHGALLVDPRDVDGIASAMTRLLTDDGECDALRDQARQMPVSTWDDYADSLWSVVGTAA